MLHCVAPRLKWSSQVGEVGEEIKITRAVAHRQVHKVRTPGPEEPRFEQWMLQVITEVIEHARQAEEPEEAWAASCHA